MNATLASTEWMSRRACWDTTVDFHAEGQAGIAEAKEVCGRCPVIGECLEYALARQEPHGVQGGLDPKERAVLVAKRQLDVGAVEAKCRNCRTIFHATSRKAWYCAACQIVTRQQVVDRYQAKAREKKVAS